MYIETAANNDTMTKIQGYW